eukprot:15473904-Alexandrium_andersonii.AAC.1
MSTKCFPDLDWDTLDNESVSGNRPETLRKLFGPETCFGHVPETFRTCVGPRDVFRKRSVSACGSDT